MDVVALGELLVDFTSAGISGQGNQIYEANPGGAPCNVLAMLQKLGRNTAFIGKVGKDSFGEMLVSVVKEQGFQQRESAMMRKSQRHWLLYIMQQMESVRFRFIGIPVRI